MRLLDNPEPFQRENSADQLQMRMIERDMVTSKLLVHRRLSSSTYDVVKEERRDEQPNDQASKEPTNPEKDPMASICLVR